MLHQPGPVGAVIGTSCGRTRVLRYLAMPAPLLGLLLAAAGGLLGHNLAQAWTARALGDRRAVEAGFGGVRSTAQFDILGVIAAVLTVFAFGFASAVPVDTRLRRRSRGITALLAGPAFLLVWTIVLAALGQQFLDVNGVIIVGQAFSARLFGYATICAAGLFVTSLIPIPPLALGRVLWLFTPRRGGWETARYRFEEESLGRLVAFAVLLVPVLLTSLPNPVQDLAVSLGAHLSGALHGG